MPGIEEEEASDAEQNLEERVMTIRALHMHLTDDNEAQRTNIFHTKCQVHDKVCVHLIDGGSCTNVVSTHLIEQLELPMIAHPTPHPLQWMTDGNEVRVNDKYLYHFELVSTWIR